MGHVGVRACVALLVVGACASRGAEALPPEHPVVLGVNLAGSRLLTIDRILYWQHEPLYRALADLGVAHVDMQLWPVSHAGEQNHALTAARVLGNRDHPLDEPACEWLRVWPILTHGVTRYGAISINNPFVYPKEAWPDVFIPIDSVAVFDHTVTGPVLDGVECFVVCGHALSPETFADLNARVAAGATGIISRRLYERHAPGPATGRWLVVDSFEDPRIATCLGPFLGPPDVARFRFRTQVVEFRRGERPDALTVSVTPRPSGVDFRRAER